MQRKILLAFTVFLALGVFGSAASASDRQEASRALERLEALYGGSQGFGGRAVTRILEIDRQSLDEDRPSIRSERVIVYDFGHNPRGGQFKIAIGNHPPVPGEPPTLLIYVDQDRPQIRAWGGPAGYESGNRDPRFLIRTATSDMGRPLLPQVLYYLNQEQPFSRPFRNARVDDFHQLGAPVRRLATQINMGHTFLLLDRDSGHLLEYQTITSRGDVYQVRATFVQMDGGAPPSSFFNTDEPRWSGDRHIAEEWGLAREPDWNVLRQLQRGLPLDRPSDTGGGGVADRGRSTDRAQEERPSEPMVQRLTREQMQALVLVRNGSSSGSGFAARINDLPFVITNLHVLGDGSDLSLRTLGGQNLRVTAAFAARGHDVALLRVDQIPASLTLAENVFESVEIGDEVVVVGNRQGGGVATQELGRIIGVGPDRVEVDARFQQGNSGSPIIHAETGEVIGVATYMQEVNVRGADGSRDRRPDRETTTRWFGFRYDSIQGWERIDWAEWKRQYDAVAAFRGNSEALLALLRGDRDTYSRNNRLNPIIERYERDLRGRSSEDFHTRRTRELFVDLVNFSRSDVQSLDSGFYDYFQTSMYFDSSIRLQKEFRQELLNFFEERERDIRNYALGRR